MGVRTCRILNTPSANALIISGWPKAAQTATPKRTGSLPSARYWRFPWTALERSCQRQPSRRRPRKRQRQRKRERPSDSGHFARFTSAIRRSRRCQPQRRLRVLTLGHFRLRQGHARRSTNGPDTVRNEPGQSVCRSASRRELTLDGVCCGRPAFALVVVAGCLSRRATYRDVTCGVCATQ
jgi:hypothetical protein